MNVRPWLGVARAPFLLLPFTLVAAGAAAAAYEGRFGWPQTLLALVGLVALHIAVNAFNEASDMTTGIDLRTVRTPFSGGSGTLPAGHLTIGQTRVFAAANAVLGGLIGIWFATPPRVAVRPAAGCRRDRRAALLAVHDSPRDWRGLRRPRPGAAARLGSGLGPGGVSWPCRPLGGGSGLLHDLQSALPERVSRRGGRSRPGGSTW